MFRNMGSFRNRLFVIRTVKIYVYYHPPTIPPLREMFSAPPPAGVVRRGAGQNDDMSE